MPIGHGVGNYSNGRPGLLPPSMTVDEECERPGSVIEGFCLWRGAYPRVAFCTKIHLRSVKQGEVPMPGPIQTSRRFESKGPAAIIDCAPATETVESETEIVAEAP